MVVYITKLVVYISQLCTIGRRGNIWVVLGCTQPVVYMCRVNIWVVSGVHN